VWCGRLDDPLQLRAGARAVSPRPAIEAPSRNSECLPEFATTQSSRLPEKIAGDQQTLIQDGAREYVPVFPGFPERERPIVMVRLSLRQGFMQPRCQGISDEMNPPGDDPPRSSAGPQVVAESVQIMSAFVGLFLEPGARVSTGKPSCSLQRLILRSG